MASYAMAHFKLDMKLKETGYAFKGGSRLRVYLTNSLEEPPQEVPELFMEKWLAEEANEANGIKNNTPVMVVLGNPPYSVSSQNKGEWIQGLMEDYKKDLHERNIQPLSDDYIKFIRYGQHFISKNRGGILAYISNNSFLDGLIHRQMRNSLLQCFDKIYILNLHGSSKKKETNIDGSPDINVFDIQQGVSINIFVKNEDAGDADGGSFARVFYHDLYGKRETKYNYLLNNAISNISWMEINPSTPYFFFTPKDFSLREDYEKGFKIDELFPVNSSGVTTHDDTNLVGFSPFSENDQLYGYRPFDIRHINYNLKKVVRHRFQVMQHFIKRQNAGLIFKRGFTENTAPVFITNKIIDFRSWSRPGMQGGDYIAPLYLYPASNDLDAATQRRPNLNSSIVQEIASKTGLSFTAEKDDTENTFAPIDILDYIYAVLYSNDYRTKYREFLKIDFPRVPYPENAEQFYKLSSIGSLLRNLHLMENVSPVTDMADFPVPGTNEIETIQYKAEKVYVNKHQYFENIPPEIWTYYIGGYQPAQKWLKDRKGRVLSFEDIEHYQKIIAVLKMTIELQAQIDEAVYL
jgi:predicted helicase